MHPSEAIRGKKSDKLKGKRILLAITGGIASVECIKLARELIRHGAEVTAIMSNEACKILSPMAMEFATGNEVITELSGKVEHVSYNADLLLIAPCTANTLSKISLGIADNVITTFAVAFRNKIVIVPSMHISMYENPFVQQNIKRCREKGIIIIPPKIEENKAKMANIEDIVERVIRYLRSDKKGKILIIGGATYEAIDDVRAITNFSSGKMALALAKEAYERGMEVIAWASFEMPDYIKTKNFRSIEDLIGLIEKENERYDIAINCAAISDFIVKKKNGKIESGKEISLKLYPAPRINPLLKKIAKVVIAFKLDEEKNLMSKAEDLLKKDNVDYVVANTLKSIGSNEAKIWIVGKEGIIKEAEGKKEDIAKEIIDLI